MSTTYQTIKSRELRSVNDEFSFSNAMRNSIGSELWKGKEAFWTILSAMVDDTAKECYSKINNMVSEIADIETCNIHALKSIAKSVDAEFLTENLEENYDIDILNLINLFSVQRELLLNTNVYLHDSVIDKTFGYLTLKSTKIDIDKISIDLINDIRKNAYNFKKIFEANLMPITKSINNFLNDDFLKNILDNFLENISDDFLENVLENVLNNISENVLDDFLENVLNNVSNFKKYIKSKILDELNKLTLEKVLNNISSFEENDDLSIYTKYELFINGEEIFQKISKNIENINLDNLSKNINFYYLLINIIKQNYFNERYQTYMIASYFDDNKYKEVDISKLIFKIVGTLFFNNEKYLNEYVGFHFFNTIQSKLINDKLKSNYVFDNKLKCFIFNSEIENEMTKDEFIAEITSYVSYEDALKFIKENELLKFRHEVVEFVKNCTKFNKELELLKLDEKQVKKLELNILKINYINHIKNTEERESIIKTLYGENGIIYHFTKKYVNECIHIQNIRNQLKNLIQQYTFIGTKKIATDIFYDFFIRNFSKNSDFDYMLSSNYNISSSIMVDGNYDFNNVKRSVSNLIKGTQNLKTYEDDNFSVNIIEYYDSTQYLNIEAELPLTFSENVVTHYEKVVSTYIDENYLMASAYVNKPVYTTSYIPCSVFVKDYNEKFWTNKNIIIKNNDENFNKELNEYEYSNSEDYIKFYSSYIPDLENLSLDTFKKDYITKELKPLLNDIWETFALSAMNDPDLDSDIGVLYKEYIGNGFGVNKYENHLNKTFPTIAPAINIENLIETKQYDSEFLLFLAKVYYANVFEKIKIATLDILKMYNEDHIPHEGWRHSYITFHGYSTSYEFSDNKLLYSIKVNDLYKVNGPFVYKKLQEYIFYNELQKSIGEGGELDISNFLKDFYPTENVKRLCEYFYINEKNKIYFKNDTFYVGKIKKYEEDIYENHFTLFKDDNNITGKLFFRAYNMPLSIPLLYNDQNNNVNVLSIGSFEIQKDLLEITNNCIDFGFLDNIMWLFGGLGKIDDKPNNNYSQYKLVIFKYEYSNGSMKIDTSTYKSFSSNGNIDHLRSLNDYIGNYYDDKTISFLLFDCYETLNDLSKIYQNKCKNNGETSSEKCDVNISNILQNYNLNFTLISVNIDTFEIKKIKISKNENALNNGIYCLPMFLKHNNIHEINNDEHIWNVIKKDDTCYITYKSLDIDGVNDDKIFEYYVKYNGVTIVIPSILISWNADLDYVDIKNIKDDFIIESSHETDKIILRSLNKNNNNEIINEIINENIKSFFGQCEGKNGLSNCYIKNNRIYSKITPLNIGYEFSNNFYQILLKKIVSEDDLSSDTLSSTTYYLTFEKMHDILSSCLTKNDENYYNIQTKNYLERSVINDSIEYDEILNSYKYIQELIDSKLGDESKPYLKIDNNENSVIFEDTKEYYEMIPGIKNCCLDQLKISFVFLNDSGITFLNDSVIDLDITCYINDEIEKYKRVGYGNPYNRTNYIYWSGDVRDGGVESITVDVQKYIKNKLENVEHRRPMNIVFNVCWHSGSEIQPSNVYALITWNNLIEKFPISLFGINTLDCKTKTFEIDIDMKTKSLSIDFAKIYPVVSLNYKEKLEGHNGLPDIELGTINLTKNDLEKLIDQGWLKYDIGHASEIYYKKYKHHITNDHIIQFLIINDNHVIQSYNEKIVLDLYKNVILDLIFYKSVNSNETDKTLSEVALSETFFGVGSGINDDGIDFNYSIYLNPKYFKKSKSEKYKVDRVINGILKTASMSLNLKNEDE